MSSSSSAAAEAAGAIQLLYVLGLLEATYSLVTWQRRHNDVITLQIGWKTAYT